jgi:hypothetical protein
MSTFRPLESQRLIHDIALKLGLSACGNLKLQHYLIVELPQFTRRDSSVLYQHTRSEKVKPTILMLTVQGIHKSG